jgi:outer membrane murein-binding lipoprotein Lpp
MTDLTGGIIVKEKLVVVIVVTGALLLGGCGEQLAVEAQKAVDQMRAEATKIATTKIDALKGETLVQLKKIRDVGEKEKVDDKSAK